MKRCLKILSVFPLAILATCAQAHSIELRVIVDSVIWPVHSSSKPRIEEWWLLSPDGETDGAQKVTVMFHRPYCSKQQIEPCEIAAYSQNVDVLVDNGANTRPTPPFYLLRGGLDWQRSRRGRISGRFDLTQENSQITLALDGDRYLVARTLSADKDNLTITVRAGFIDQEIYVCQTGGANYPYCGDEGFEEMLWAGDLDGDDRLDFISQFTDKYTMRRYYLYKSRDAGPGRLVAIAAEYGHYTE